ASRLLRSPQRVRGAVELLAWRVRARRASARVRRDGTPTVAVLGRPRSGKDDERPDLVGLGRAAKLVRLARRPAGVARVDGAGGALLSRLLGVPVGGEKASPP
ncbi:MAG: hypothetical protein ACR2NB_01275, partial [Solirubrobacteraceae bacterium]